MVDTRPLAAETVDLVEAKMIYVGDNGVEDRGKVNTIKCSLVLQFKSAEEMRTALADGACRFNW